MNPTLRREIHPEVRIVDAAKGIVDYTASDETLDYYAEVIRVAGWRFTNFAKNSPFVDSHDYSTITKLLGQVTDFAVNGGQLIETVTYARQPGSLAEWAFKMVRDGFLKAVSVGFIPEKMATRWDSNQADFLAQVADLKLDAQAAGNLRAVYLQQEQIELSQCVIGANPNALARAYKAGCLTEQDLDQFSAIIASTKTAAPAAVSAGAGAALPRTKLAILAAIQSHL